MTHTVTTETESPEKLPAAVPADVLDLGAASVETRGRFSGLIQETSVLPWRMP